MTNLSTERARGDALPPDRRPTRLRPSCRASPTRSSPAIAREASRYARPLRGRFGRGIRAGVEEALRQFVELIEPPGAGRVPGRDVYVALGRGELRAGPQPRRRCSPPTGSARASPGGGSRPRGVARRPDAGDAVPAGRVDLRLHRRALRRRRPRATRRSSRAAAGERARAGASGSCGCCCASRAAEPAASRRWPRAAPSWRLPRAAGRGLRSPRPSASALARAAAGRTRSPRASADVVLLVGRPRRARAAHEVDRRALAGRRAALGPTVPWASAALELARAARRRAGREGAAAGARRCSAPHEHVAELLLRRDRRLARGARRAAPRPARRAAAGGPRAADRDAARLARPPGRRAAPWPRRCTSTRRPSATASRQLRELFGDALDDPDGRFELELALRAEALAGTV